MEFFKVSSSFSVMLVEMELEDTVEERSSNPSKHPQPAFLLASLLKDSLLQHLILSEEEHFSRALVVLFSSLSEEEEDDEEESPKNFRTL